MASILTHVQGRALKQVLHSSSPSLSRFNMEPTKFQAFGARANIFCQQEAAFAKVPGLYHAFPPLMSGFSSPTTVRFSFSFRYFNYLARSYPYRVGLVIATTKACLADIVAQKVVEKKRELDYKRTALFFAFGALYSGGICNALYNSIYPRIFSSRIPQVNALLSALADNLVNTPFIMYPVLYSMKECFLEFNGNLRSAWQKYRDEVFQCTKTSWKIWFPAHLVTFGLLPIHLRLPFVSCISFVFFTIVSLEQQVLKQQRELALA